MSNQKSFRGIAREAKARLKSGFWESAKDNFTDEVERARENGLSESRACRYFAGKVTCSIRGATMICFMKRCAGC